MADYVLLVTDQNLNIVGDPIAADWTTLDVTLRFNEPDSSQVAVPGYPWIRDAVDAPGNRIVCIRNGDILTAGPVEQHLHEQSDDGENAGDGTLTVYWADDSALIAAREVYPDPAQPPTSQTPDKWTFTGNGEVALRTLVDLNAGPGAIAERRIPQLVLGASAGVGTSVQVAATRMQHLGDLARQIAETGGGLGFRTRQVNRQIVFEVYTPPDKSHLVRFGFALGNMRYRSRTVKAPTVTTAIVGGQGDGADTAMIVRTNAADEAAWGRFERFVPQPGSQDAQVLQDAGDRELGEGAPTEQIATNVSDSPDQQFSTHYTLGDRVSLENKPGSEVSEIVRTVHIQVTAGAGEYVSPTVGSQEALSDPAWLKRVQEIDARLGRVERSVNPV